MATAGHDLLELLLRECARTAPEPLYPSQFAAATSVPRPEIEATFDRLRLGGLVRLTDWVAGRGQGYVLTPEGTQTVQTPRLLDRLRRHGVPPQPVPSPLRPTTDVRTSPWKRGEEVRQVLLGDRRPVLSAVFIFLILLGFLVGLNLGVQRRIPINRYLAATNDRGVTELLHDIGAITPSDVLARDEWWRLLSHVFVHVGLLHLLLNVFALSTLGPLLETAWGPMRFLGLYWTAGLGAGCVVVLTKSTGITAGASGAICGLFTGLLVWFAANRRYLPPEVVSRATRNLVINSVLIIGISMMPGVSWQGHLGGAVAGAAFAGVSVWERYHRGWRRWVGLAGMFAVPVLCLASVFVVVSPWERFKWLWPDVNNSLVDSFRHVSAYLDSPEEFPNNRELVRNALLQFEHSKELLDRARRQLEWVTGTHAREQVIKDAKDCVDGWLAFLQILEDLMQRRRELTNELQWQLDQRLADVLQKTQRMRDAVL